MKLPAKGGRAKPEPAMPRVLTRGCLLELGEKTAKKAEKGIKLAREKKIEWKKKK